MMSPKMVELHDIDVPEFLKVLDSCEGEVYLMTRDGNRLNLKSKLCQYIALTQMFDEGIVGDFDLRLSDIEDLDKIKHYLIMDKKNG